MQNLKSIRTQAALALCLHERCKGCVLATGTPMKNGRPSNLFPLLVAIRHPIARHKINFETKYCNAKKTKFCPWDISGSSNLTELKTIVGEYIIRMTKVYYYYTEYNRIIYPIMLLQEECLSGLPPLSRQRIVVEVSQKDQEDYSAIIKSYKSQNARYKRDPSAALTMMSALRQLTSLSKVMLLRLLKDHTICTYYVHELYFHIGSTHFRDYHQIKGRGHIANSGVRLV
jgi:SNF2 family DNA or RNA helicase